MFRTEQFARSTENEHPTPAPGKPTLPPTTDSIANLTWYIDATGIEQISPPLG